MKEDSVEKFIPTAEIKFEVYKALGIDIPFVEEDKMWFNREKINVH